MNQRVILVAAALTAAASLAASAAGARLQDAGILLREIKQNAAALAKAAPDARAALQERQTELQGKLAELKRGLPGGAWDRHEFETPAHRKDRAGTWRIAGGGSAALAGAPSK
jgi:Flp pilus assembly protein TadB